MILLIPVVVLLGVAVGIVFGWRWVLAPLLGWLVWMWASTMLRSMVGAGRSGAPDAPAEPTHPDERTLFWCEECGTEMLLLVRGTNRAPRHCGLRMHERTEVPN